MAFSAAKDVYEILLPLMPTNVGLYTNAVPDGPGIPANLVSVIDGRGRRADKAMSSGSPVVLENPAVQVRIMNTRADRSSQLAYEIYKELDGFSGTVDGVIVDYIDAMPPRFLVRDEKNRVVLVVDCVVTRRPH